LPFTSSGPDAAVNNASSPGEGGEGQRAMHVLVRQHTVAVWLSYPALPYRAQHPGPQGQEALALCLANDMVEPQCHAPVHVHVAKPKTAIHPSPPGDISVPPAFPKTPAVFVVIPKGGTAVHKCSLFGRPLSARHAPQGTEPPWPAQLHASIILTHTPPHST
jgi:hypothetical protein